MAKKPDKDTIEKLLAVALSYERNSEEAPKITAKGQGLIAEQIVKIAREHDIEIRQDAGLVEILSVLDVDSYIPLEAYAAVAEILSYIYQKNRPA